MVFNLVVISRFDYTRYRLKKIKGLLKSNKNKTILKHIREEFLINRFSNS